VPFPAARMMAAKRDGLIDGLTGRNDRRHRHPGPPLPHSDCCKL
jgi:hypothetical protein